MNAANAPAYIVCIVYTSSSSSSSSSPPPPPQLHMYERKGNKRTIYIEGGSWVCVYHTASISALVLLEDMDGLSILRRRFLEALGSDGEGGSWRGSPVFIL